MLTKDEQVWFGIQHDIIYKIISYIFTFTVYLYAVKSKKCHYYWTYTPKSVRFPIKVLAVNTVFVKKFKKMSFIMQRAIVLKVTLFLTLYASIYFVHFLNLLYTKLQLIFIKLIILIVLTDITSHNFVSPYEIHAGTNKASHTYIFSKKRVIIFVKFTKYTIHHKTVS